MSTNSLPTLSSKPGEAPALAILASETATSEEKARACQQLAVTGTAKAVPILAALLQDEKLSSHARSGLEIIDDPSAAKALRDSLASLRGGLLSGAITSLGVRRDAASVPEIHKLAGSPEADVRSAAISALGQIASPDAVAKLRSMLAWPQPEARIAVAHALIAATCRLDAAAATAVREAIRAADLPDFIRKVAG